MFKKIITIIIILCTVGCKTLETAKDSNTMKDNKTEIADNNKSDVKENNEIKEETSKDEIVMYGSNSEIQSIYINGKKYYVLNADNIENMTENEIKNSSLVAPLKITEETIKGNDGIVIKYYDVQIFLEKKNRIGATKVGLFEPQYRAWTIGEYKKRNNDIELKLSNSTVTITIKRGSISLRYY
ncbi:hypothetical protein [Brachyspira pilosicoli]|uniref:Uncharacterized protein n=1 Tax=Brachyspira pilosicoli TaxID=52584 RepID=A0A5C8EWG1_BRAPL|nr:hypothetical protein [Brachyspira pilosicoli]TXJ41823.1 hypothetical protein EPJ72_06430 [Brachyspira pilosicoli]